MKKSIKILTLVLTLALICGALVISAFAADEAAVTGVTQGAYLDFQDSPTDDYGSHLDGVASVPVSETKTLAGVIPQIWWKSNGKAALSSSEYDSENKYFLWTSTDGSSQSYVETFFADRPSVSNDTLNMKLKAGTDVKYFIMDVDLMLPVAGVAPKNAGFIINFRTIPDGGTAQGFLNANHTGAGFSNNILNIQATGKTNGYAAAGGWAANGNIVLGTDWTHVTVVLENEILQNADGKNYVKITEYIYANGVNVADFVWFDNSACKDPTLYWGEDLTNFNYCDGRINFPFDATGAQIAIDNFNVRFLSNEYNGNLQNVLDTLAPITNADVNVYDPDNMPFGQLAATNTTQDKNYDSFNKAVAAAEDDDEIVLKANLTKDVTLDKWLYIIPGEYSVGEHLKTAEGWQLEYDETEGYWFTSEVTDPATITWGACTCGLDTCDETHPGSAESSIGLNANIYEAYELAVPNGYDWNVTVDGVYYYLAGWKNAETEEELATDAVVTEDMLGSSFTYTPIIKTKLPLYSYVDLNGNPATGFSENTFAEIVADAASNSTITLLGDVEIPDTASIAITKNLTIDLNGHVLSDNKVVAAKYPTFSVGASLTFKGDKEGSMIVKAHNVQGKNGYLGHLCQPTASAGTINFKGENLRVFAPSLAASWGVTINISIDGGYYARGNASDNDGWVYANASTATNISVKNAVFGDIHALLSVYAGNTKAHNFTADNCVFVGQVLKMLTAGFTNSTITNCYIASSATIGTASEGGSVQLGAGNWIESGAKIDLLTYENNISLFSASNSITIPVHKIQFANVDGAVTYSIETTEATYNFNNYTADSSKIATVTWYDTDGVTVLGTTEGIPGLAASAPLVPVADGWVNALYTEWTNANGEKTTIIPVDATEVSFTLVGGSAATYVVGKVPLWMNWSYLTHSCINVYVPENAPAGVVMTGAKLNGIDRINSFKGGFMVADTPVKRMQVWPELANVDDGIPAQITFTYAGETFTYNATADVAKYIGQVLDGNHREEQKQAIAAWAGYIITANTMAGKTANADLVALYNSEKVQNYLPEYQLGVTAAPDVSALSTYIETVSVVFGGNTNSVAFKLVPTAALAGAGYTLAVDMTGATLREIDGVYYINGVHAHYFDNEFTISIKNGEEVVASAKYSLGGYLYSIQSSADANLKAFIQAAWLYCSAISDIKNY